MNAHPAASASYPRVQHIDPALRLLPRIGQQPTKPVVGSRNKGDCPGRGGMPIAYAAACITETCPTNGCRADRQALTDVERPRTEPRPEIRRRLVCPTITPTYDSLWFGHAPRIVRSVVVARPPGGLICSYCQDASPQARSPRASRAGIAHRNDRAARCRTRRRISIRPALRTGTSTSRAGGPRSGWPSSPPRYTSN